MQTPLSPLFGNVVSSGLNSFSPELPLVPSLIPGTFDAFHQGQNGGFAQGLPTPLLSSEVASAIAFAETDLLTAPTGLAPVNPLADPQALWGHSEPGVLIDTSPSLFSSTPNLNADSETKPAISALDANIQKVGGVDPQDGGVDGAVTGLVIIDPTVANLDALLAGLKPGLEAIVLDSDADGVIQISQALARYTNLESLHIISHGTSNQLQLGTTILGQESLDRYAAEFRLWNEALAIDADILLYACNVAAESTSLFLERLALLTGADIAASNNLTGSATLGGDWDLEYQTGSIESDLALSAAAMAGFQSVLATVTVTTAIDENNGNTTSIANLIATPGGAGISLREAIIAANNTAGADRIEFNIPGAGPHTITLALGNLPNLSDPNGVTIDGYTQPGASENTLATAGTNANLQIILRQGGPRSGTGLNLTSGNNTVRGLVIQNFQNGIQISGSVNNQIQGNFFGVNQAGTSATGNNNFNNIFVQNTSSIPGQQNLIGGTNLGDRNLISGGDQNGILFRNSVLTTLVQNNLIGPQPNGVSVPAGVLQDDGIRLRDTSSNVQIGGFGPNERNFIVRNRTAIRFEDGSSNNSILNNVISTNLEHGIYNVGTFPASTGIRISGNNIFDNGDQGIKLLPGPGVPPNDAGDADAGPNSLQNFPVLTAVLGTGSDIFIEGTFNSIPNLTFRLEFFANVALNVSTGANNFGEGERYLGFINVTTDASGNAAFSTSFTAPTPPVAIGEFITATAISPTGDTSEFSLGRVVLANTAPTLNNTGDVLLPAIDEDTLNPAGLTIAALLATGAGGNPITDPDASAVEGIAITAADNSNGTWQFSLDSGTTWNAVGAVNAAAARLLADTPTTRIRFVPAANFNGDVDPGITFRAWDQIGGVNGGTADTTTSGGNTAFSADQEMARITVNPINDAPINTVPAAQVTNEDVALIFSTGGGNLISISDVDAGAATDIEVTLTATNGLLALNPAGIGALTFITGTGTNDATMTFTGSIANINIALDGLTFTPTLNFNGAASIQITTNDNGNTGTPGALTDTDTVNITVNAVNDAPVNTVPVAQTTAEDTSLVFNVANANLISIADVDAGASNIELTLAATNGLVTLSSLVGLTFFTGDGSSDSNMIFRGTIAAINAALDGLSFTPTPNFNGAASLQVLSDDLGNTGSGGSQTDNDIINITVDAVNDPPTVAAPAVIAVTEDVATSLTGITVADLDAGANPVEITLAVPTGTLTATAAGGVTVGGTPTNLTLTGPIANLNNFISNGNLRYTTALNATAPVTLGVIVDDLGSVGIGGQQTSAPSNVNLVVTAINDAPVNTVPGAQATPEDTPVVFTGANAISIDDVDANPNPVQVSLVVTNGLLTLSGTTGLTFTLGDGMDDLAMTFTGLLADINAALNNLTFTPTTNFAGTTTLQVVTSDLGNSGNGGPETDTDTVSITVGGANDPPVVILPVAQTTNEDTPLVLTGATAIAVTDPDAGISPVQVQLTATNGLLTLSSITGLTFAVGNGVDDATMTFTGTIANINNALDGLLFAPTANFSGAASIQIQVNDQGNTGAGGALTDTKTLAITVDAVNDAPTIAAPATIALTEDVSTALNGFTFNDVDAAGGTVIVTLAVPTGTLAAVSGGGVVVSGIATNRILTGTIANINAFIAANNITYTPAADVNGNVSLALAINDDGNTGVGGAQIGTTSINLAIAPVNDAPVNTVPGAQTVNENTALVFSTANGNLIAIADVDAGANSVQVTLNATNGTVTFNGSTAASVTATGSVATLNALLNGVQFTPTPDLSGAASLQVLTSDLGNTGTPGALTDDDTIAITVNAVNNPPVNTVPGSQTIAEDTILTFTGPTAFSISDPDAGANPVQVTLTSTNGNLTLAGTSGLAFATGDGNADPTMTFTGTIAAINTALSSLVFAPNADFHGSASVLLQTNDQGNTGLGGPLTDVDTVVVTITPLADTPSVSNTTTNLNTQTTSGLVIARNLADGPEVTHFQVTNITSGTLFQNNGTTPIINGQFITAAEGLAGLRFTPNLGFTGNGTFQVQASTSNSAAGLGGNLVTATINVLSPVNNPPTTTGLQNVIANEDAANTPVNLLAAFNDLESGPAGLTYTVINNTNPVLFDSTTIATGILSLDYAANANGTADITVRATDPGGLSVDSTFTITVQPVNDAPTFATLGNQVLPPGTTSPQVVAGWANSFVFGPADEAGQVVDDFVVTILSDPNNIFTIAPDIADNGTLTYVPNGNSGTANLAVRLRDSGGTVNGGTNLSEIVNLAITVGADTIAPTAALSAITPITIGGAAFQDFTVTFTDNIALNVASLDNADIQVNGQAATFQGVDFNSNGSPRSVIYRIAAPGGTWDSADNGTYLVSIQSNQVFDTQGNSVLAGLLGSFAVNITNQAPLNTLPLVQIIDEDTPLIFSTANSNAISITDDDLGNNPIQVILTTANGDLTLATTAGLTFAVGDGTADNTLVFTGNLTSVNAALNGLRLTPAANFNGVATLQVTTNDLGGTGTGPAQSDSDIITVIVNAVNDAPINNLPTNLAVDEDTVLTLAGASVISISDPDGMGGAYQVSLAIANGALTLGSTANLAFTTGDGTDDAAMTFIGTLGSVNAALNGLRFTPAANFAGTANLQIATTELTGTTPEPQDIDTLAITVNPVNDRPVNTLPAAQTTDTDQPLVLSSANGNAITVSDPDAGSNPIEVTLSAVNGLVTLANTAGLTFLAGDGTTDATITVRGTIADLNAALDGLEFAPAAGFSGVASLELQTNDRGNTGTPGPLTDTDALTITVNAVGSIPTPGNLVPGLFNLGDLGGEAGIFVVGGNLGEPVVLQFDWIFREAVFDNEIGLVILDDQGQVNGVSPTDPNFALTALTSAGRQTIFRSGQGAGDGVDRVFTAGTRLLLYLIQNASLSTWLATNPQNLSGAGLIVMFSHRGANPSSFSPIQSQSLGNGSLALAWEDVLGGGDRDFNDVVLRVGAGVLRVPGQPNQTTNLQVQLLNVEADFENELGFFFVDDAAGRINGLNPGDPGYTQAAFRTGNFQVVSARGQGNNSITSLPLIGRRQISWYLIQDGSTIDFILRNLANVPGQGPIALFGLANANPGASDQLRRLSGSSFAFEDTIAGDQDFNDKIFQVNF